MPFIMDVDTELAKIMPFIMDLDTELAKLARQAVKGLVMEQLKQLIRVLTFSLWDMREISR